MVVVQEKTTGLYLGPRRTQVIDIKQARHYTSINKAIMAQIMSLEWAIAPSIPPDFDYDRKAMADAVKKKYKFIPTGTQS